MPITEVGPDFGSKFNPQRRSFFGLSDICLINLEEQEEKTSNHPHLKASVGTHGGTGTHIFPAAPPLSSFLPYY